MTLWMWTTIVMLIVVNALYVAAEFAVVGARVSRVERCAEDGSRLARALLPVVREPDRLDRYIAACQIGITFSSLVLGAFGQATLGLALGAWLEGGQGWDTAAAYGTSALVVLVGLTCTQVVLGELLPKTVALQYPVRTAMYTYPPMSWSLWLFRPFIALLNGSGNVVLKLMRVPSARHRHLHSVDEIELLVRESGRHGVLDSVQSARLREALRLERHTARQLMVPRRQIASLDLTLPVASLVEQVQASPFTRLVAHQGGLDDVRGFLHAKDLAAVLATDGPPVSLEPLLRPLMAIPRTLTIDRVLGQLRDRRARLALVVSEFGDIEGLISLEDVIRELLGAMSDEFKADADDAPQALPDGRWRLAGRMPLDEVAEWADGALAPQLWRESDAETLAGWLIERIDAMPRPGHRVTVEGLEFEVERMAGMAIASVLARRPVVPSSGDDDG